MKRKLNSVYSLYSLFKRASQSVQFRLDQMSQESIMHFLMMSFSIAKSFSYVDDLRQT